jgi:CRP/FNR family cyclic AMP-dependent transcriptional regulator
MRASMDHPHLIGLLRSNPLFQDLDQDEIADITRLMRRAEYAAGATVFRQGAPADHALLLAAGAVAISTRLPGDERVRLAEVGPGELIGEIALNHRTTRLATATAMTPVSGFILDNADFAAMRAQYRPAAFKVLRRLSLLLCARLRRISEDLAASLADSPDPVPRAATPPPDGQPTRWSAQCRRLLPILPFFQGFAAEEIDELVACSLTWSLPRGHVLFVEGEPAASCFITVRGAVQVAVLRGERRSRLALLGPGRLFGELPLLDGGPRSATAQVREDALLLELGRDAFDRLSRGGTRTAFKVLEAVNRNLVAAQQRAVAHRASLAAGTLRGG